MKIKHILIVSLFPGIALFAQNWTGAVNSDWNNPANWSETPGNGDDITIDPANYTGAMAQPLLAGTSVFTPAEMLIQNGAQLTISGNLNATDRVEILGTGTQVLITGGTFALTGGGNSARLIFAEDAALRMNGGILNVGQRLLFELGGVGEINAGTISVGETLALVDGSPNGPSKLVQNGGSITTNGEFGFENEAGTFFPAFEQHGGELHINGDLLWLGAAPGAGRGYFRSSGGTVYVSGAIGNDPTSTMGMQIELSGNTALLENSGNSVHAFAGDSILLSGGAHWLDVNTVSWQNEGVFFAREGGRFSSGNTTLDGSGLYQFDVLYIPALKLLNHVSPALLSVSGAIDVAGAFNHGNNKLVLNGISQQALTAPALGLTLYDLEIVNRANGPADGGYGITLNCPLTISHELHFTDGIISAVPGADIRLLSTAAISGGSDTTFVDGYIEKQGNTAIEFPLGSAPDRYRPLSVSGLSSTPTLLRVAYRFEAFSSLLPVESPLQSVSGIEYWDLSRSGSADAFSLSAGWNDASQSGLSNCNDISLANWDGSQWLFVASATTGLCDGTNAGSLASSLPLPFAGPVTIGFTENVNQQSVDLCAGESLTVGTSTYTETGVYTDVLEDSNGNDSIVVSILTVWNPPAAEISSHGTYLSVISPGATAFQWIDCNNQQAIVSGATAADFYPLEGGSYAVIVSRNGCSHTSACLAIDPLGLNPLAADQLKLYPNPLSKGNTLQVSSPVPLNSWTMFTPDGRQISNTQLPATSRDISLDLADLPTGTYLIELGISDGKHLVKRLIIQ